MKHVPTLTAPAVLPGESTPRVSSRQVAEAFDKSHRHLLRAIKKIVADAPSEFTEPNFGLSEYLDPTGRKLPHYLLTRDAFCLLVMGFTGERALAWQVRYIEAFNEMEKAIRKRLLLSGPEAPALIRKVLDFARRLTPERKREIRKAFRYKAMGHTNAEVGRLLGCGPTKAGNLLREHSWLKGGQ